MSQQAYNALTTDQVNTLEAFNPILSASLLLKKMVAAVRVA